MEEYTQNSRMGTVYELWQFNIFEAMRSVCERMPGIDLAWGIDWRFVGCADGWAKDEMEKAAGWRPNKSRLWKGQDEKLYRLQ